MAAHADLPWDLADGIRLEGEDQLLAWGTDISLLESLGHPTVNDRTSSLHITWPRRHVLGGLQADVQAVQIRETPNPRAFRIYLPTFHYARLMLCETHDDTPRAHQQLRETHDRMARHFGTATFCYPDYSHAMPVIFWELGRVVVSLGPRLGQTHLVCTIRHEPDGYDALRAEAERIRTEEGEGARVDHVVWPEHDDGG